MSDVHFIVGLGNPGKEYAYTRHNLGFLVVQHLVEKNNLSFKKSSFTKGLEAEGIIDGNHICFFLPMTYMNNSGMAIKERIVEKEIISRNMLIISDDIHLEFGQLRLKSQGGHGGHNGLKSIIQNIGTKKFARLRMGIDLPLGKKDIVDYVLENFSKKELQSLELFISEAANCCLSWVKNGINRTMERYNGKQ